MSDKKASITCPDCTGNGRLECPACQGDGYRYGDGCPKCDTDGFLDVPCLECKGEGQIVGTY
jgi:RecJ-like exonuclease